DVADGGPRQAAQARDVGPADRSVVIERAKDEGGVVRSGLLMRGLPREGQRGDTSPCRPVRGPRHPARTLPNVLTKTTRLCQESGRTVRDPRAGRALARSPKRWT